MFNRAIDLAAVQTSLNRLSCLATVQKVDLDRNRDSRAAQGAKRRDVHRTVTFRVVGVAAGCIQWYSDYSDVGGSEKQTISDKRNQRLASGRTSISSCKDNSNAA